MPERLPDEMKTYVSAESDYAFSIEQADVQSFHHVLVVKDTRGARLVPLESTSHSIGRAKTNSIVLQSKAVSRQHALLLRVTSSDPNSFGFLIIDGNLQGQRSTNGIAINGDKCHSHRLSNGDQISFGSQVLGRYLILNPQTDESFAQFCRQADCEELLHNFTPQSNFFTGIGAADNFSETSLVRLASFPEISPSPMFEINLDGELTYFNPAAAEAFPDMGAMGIQHPSLNGVLNLVKNEPEQEIWVREIEIASHIYEQSIHYISESDLIRCCVFDITGRKHAEAELRRRDRLLQSVAEATTHLLENVGYDEAINKALATLGAAARADRICICVNHPHPEDGSIATSMKYEWVNDSIPALLSNPERQNQRYSSSLLKRWYHTLTDENALRGLVRELPESERESLQASGALAILVVPIIIKVDNNYDFWGFLELHQCVSDSLWSPQEESIVFAMAASISAALQRHRTEEIIHHQAFHDVLTGLPNRSLFNTRLSKSLESASLNEHHVAVMFMDLDRFKTINDTLGHSIGDQLLGQVSERLRDCLRDGDTVARWGGDEFTVLLPTVEDVNDAVLTAHRILGSLKTPFELNDHELFVDASIGIALYPNDGHEAEMLLQNADVALYRCKEQGRGRCELYSPAMNSRAPELFVLENSLHHALEREEFLLYYQPKVEIKTGRIVGLEALLRWAHPELGLVSPAKFIPIAEETGLIVDIGEWVIQTACNHTVQWHQAGLCPLSVAVNLSARQFYQPNLVATVAQCLQTSGLDPDFLEIEITETIAVRQIDFAQQVLQQLQDMGVRIAMDDFGTGYSSLNYLKKLPLDTLKIDQSFLLDLQPGTKDIQIINAIITLGQGLNLHVVAEGVDSDEKLDILRELNCDIAQGYLFSRPVDFDQAMTLLQENWQQTYAEV